MKYCNWNISGYDRETAVLHCHRGINPLVAVILASRGIANEEETASLLGENFSILGDPFAMQDMDAAVRRLKDAIKRNEHVAVYGDYDVDGMTSSSLLASYLRSRGLDCEIYIPDRMDEGYGVNTAALDALGKKGVTLVLTVDCGITAIEETKFARSLGMDLIITDHHECNEVLPDASAVIDPKRHDCKYPFKALAGVGVAFKLVCAMEGNEHFDRLISRYGDLVALGTIADVMPVTGENRFLIRRGMAAMKQGIRPGLRMLMSEAGLDGKSFTSGAIGFSLAPRLNAAGRMGCASRSVELLLTDNESEAIKGASELCALNSERRLLENEIFDEALTMLKNNPPVGTPIILANRNWHQGVMGIVASRLTDQFNLPAIVISIEDGVGRGSCRCLCGFNLYSALAYCSDFLDSFGGHELAAGLTIPEAKIELFKKRLTGYYQNCAKIPTTPSLNIDFEVIKPGLLTIHNVSALESLEPYGNGNPAPILCIKEAVLESVTSIGGGRHIKIIASKFGENFECVYFSKSAEDLDVRIGDLVDLAFGPRINIFRGKKSLQLFISDICFSAIRGNKND